MGGAFFWGALGGSALLIGAVAALSINIHRQVLELLFARSEMGRPFVLPPGVPADRVAMLRRAFIDTTKDPS